MPETVPTSRIISPEDITQEQRLRLECMFIAASYKAGVPGTKTIDIYKAAEKLLPYARDGKPIT
jgi:hypothetical protein